MAKRPTAMSAKTETRSGSDTVKAIRHRLGLTQAALARALGVSIRAIQSYEQGWRDVPNSIFIQMLVLVAAYRHTALDGTPCWEITDCPVEKRAKCPSTKTGGHLCWFVSGRMCEGAPEMDDDDMLPCLECPVVQRMLS
jgi:DNA-binding transcriptional regulator YiaG